MKSRESAEIRVGSYHGAIMLDCHRRVLSVGDQLPGGSGFPAQPLENVQVIRAGSYDPRVRTFHKRGNECERLVKSGRRPEDTWISCHTDEAGQNENRERKGIRPCRQASDPIRILRVVGYGVLDVGVYKDIYVGKQHYDSLTPRRNWTSSS